MATPVTITYREVIDRPGGFIWLLTLSESDERWTMYFMEEYHLNDEAKRPIEVKDGSIWVYCGDGDYLAEVARPIGAAMRRADERQTQWDRESEGEPEKLAERAELLARKQAEGDQVAF